ncbi:MAG: putative rane protein, partial [Verrucomicrobiota bacterium]
MTFADLPIVNASLNGLSAILLGCGYYFVKRHKLIAHRNCMIAAFCTSAVFLVCYLTYHFKVGRTVFLNPEWFRPIYLTLLLTHTVLAVTIVPMILITMNRALKERFDLHKKIAKWT